MSDYIKPIVYVLFRDYGVEGKSAPVAVTTIYDVAQAWKLSGEGMGARYSIHTLDHIPEQE